MIPLELSLRNFLCYRDGVPPLVFDGVRLACLSGDNGAGKSALLDAITWALWGKSRCSQDVDLISLGADEARVEFTFRLEATDYRVSRRLRRGAATRNGTTGAPRTWLELQALDTDGAWRTHSGDGVRDTQARIVDLLKLEYDTFINSAFLIQGRADEFTTKPPGERKRVLGEILGLGLYDELEQRARERARRHADEIRGLDGEVARLRLHVADEADLQAEETRHAAALAASATAMDQLTIDVQAMHRAVAALDHQDQQLRQIEAQLQTDQAMMRQVEELIAGVERDIAGLNALLARRDEIEAGAEHLLAAQQQRAALDGALRSVRALEEQRHQAERAVERARDDLVRDQRDRTRRLGELDDIARTAPDLESKRLALAAAATEASRLGAEAAATLEQQRALQEQAAEIAGENTHLKTQMQRLSDRIRQLEAADAVCPVCNRALGPDERQRALADDRAEGQQLKDVYRANEARVAALRADAERCVEAVTQLQRQRDKAEIEARQEARIAEQLDRARQAMTEQAAVQVALVDVTERLQREDYAVEERATARLLAAEIASLGYDETAHEAAAADERRLGGYAQLRIDVVAARDRVVTEEAKLCGHHTMRAELVARQERDVATAQVLREAVAQLPALRAREASLAASLGAARAQRTEAERALGRVQALLDGCRNARAALTVAEAEHRRLTDERGLLLELVEAYGRKGIQAMIIETVMPELQDETNDLLDRMPGNSMHVEFRTQRDTRSGDARETLDVVIRDELGERRYENYSGGEQFRLNFAIRVALSKLLTRRAGAQLQLLVVDEGFGTQDARGREGLIEAIRSVEHVFATVLVITHLSDIRDEFPTQVEVLKGVDGSTITVR